MIILYPRAARHGVCWGYTMVYKLEDIERQLMVGEDSISKFKEIVISEKRRVQSPDAEAIAGEMVAFANTDGGTIFLGVDERE